MIRSRLLLASALALVALAASVTPAAAGQGVTIDDDIVCNPATGEYDVTYTVTNGFADEADVILNAFQVDGVDEPLVFSPAVIAGNGGTSLASTSVPGATTALFLSVRLDYEQFDELIDAESTLDGDCVVPSTTTTTTSTTLAPTTTVAPTPVAAAIAARPAFTG